MTNVSSEMKWPSGLRRKMPTMPMIPMKATGADDGDNGDDDDIMGAMATRWHWQWQW